MSNCGDGSPVVVSRLQGGLGNQLFQYAAGYALAKHLGVPLLLDRSFLDARPTGMDWTPRDLELAPFNLQLAFAPTHLLEVLRRSRWPGSLRKQTWFRERDRCFDTAFFSQTAPVLLEGYWQCERYFASVADELRTTLFQQREAPSAVNAALAGTMNDVPCASVHVRLGDYSNAGTANYHGQPDADYYQRAAFDLYDRCGVRRFYLFSDEPEKARSRITLPGEVITVTHNIGKAAHQDLWLMQRCHHHIIANSSFSWWGAWLDPSPDKVVIAPKRWFAADERPDDIVPASWTRA